ncbi:MAG TPA: hypothetical protein VFU33_12795 [Gaiellaceae bacterium]|nr:hypothetical protein [Gaiellaceae bacterium]
MRFALALALAGAAAVVATAAYGRGAAGSIPRGFSPETAAAVGTRDLWVLGAHRCGRNYCNALVRSTDGGKHFRRVGLPALPSQGTDPTVVFANARDGFAYVEDGTPLFATRDGGESWRREGPNRVVTAFAAAGGYAYLVAGRHRIERSRVGGNAWHRLALSVSHRPFSLAARGPDVWFLGLPRHRPDFDTLSLSADSGRRFSARKGPCLAELGGTLVPAGDGVVWAVCPTGNMGELALSTNGGRSFPAIRSVHDPGGLRQPGLVNSARIAAASARVAVLSRGAGGALLRTTDAGRHWRSVPGTARIEEVFWLGFTTSRIGSALVQLGPRQTQLWRTSDGGATWHSVPIH